jgi:hypothetical protein
MRWPWQKPETNHLADYLVLTTLLITSVLLLKIFSFYKTGVLILTVALVVSYVIWGVAHHTKAGHLDRKIMWEYLGLGTLVIILVYTLIS